MNILALFVLLSSTSAFVKAATLDEKGNDVYNLMLIEMRKQQNEWNAKFIEFEKAQTNLMSELSNVNQRLANSESELALVQYVFLWLEIDEDCLWLIFLLLFVLRHWWD